MGLLDLHEDVVLCQVGQRPIAMETNKPWPTNVLSHKSKDHPVAEGDILAFFGCTARVTRVDHPRAPPSQLSHLAGASLVSAPIIDANGNFWHHVDSVYVGAPAQATINQDGNLLCTSVPSHTCVNGAALPGCLIQRLETACRTRRCSAEFDVLVAATHVQTLLQDAAVRSPGVADVMGFLTGVLPRRLDAHAVSLLLLQGAARPQPRLSQPTTTESAWTQVHENKTASDFRTSSVSSGCYCESRTSSADTLPNRNSGADTLPNCSSWKPDSLDQFTSRYRVVNENNSPLGEKKFLEFWLEIPVQACCHNRGFSRSTTF